MKKKYFLIRFIGIVLFYGFAVLSCNKIGNNPKSIIRQYLTAIDNIDEKTIIDLLSPNYSKNIIEFIDIEGAKKIINDLGGINNIEENIIGNFAIVKITFENNLKDEIDLIKIDGKWKISSEKLLYGETGWNLLKEINTVDWLEEELGK